MIIWIATFYASVAGTPMDVNDYDRPRFRSKRACYMYVMKQVPKIRQSVLDHLPFSREQIDVRGECNPEGSQRAGD